MVYGLSLYVVSSAHGKMSVSSGKVEPSCAGNYFHILF